MLIDLEGLMERYDVKATGVLHVGGHLAEEAAIYDQVGMPKVVWIEGDPVTYVEMLKAISSRWNHSGVNALVDNVSQVGVLHVANNGQSSSMLALGTHRVHHPEVSFVKDLVLVTKTLDALWADAGWSLLNFWNLDLQGAELRALQGAERSLACCDYLYLEVNSEEVYEGCPIVGELDAYLVDFVRVETHWTPHAWGDAFYIRRNLL